MPPCLPELGLPVLALLAPPCLHRSPSLGKSMPPARKPRVTRLAESGKRPTYRLRHLGLRLRVLGLRLRVLGLRLRVLGLRLRVLGRALPCPAATLGLSPRDKRRRTESEGTGYIMLYIMLYIISFIYIYIIYTKIIRWCTILVVHSTAIAGLIQPPKL